MISNYCSYSQSVCTGWQSKTVLTTVNSFLSLPLSVRLLVGITRAAESHHCDADVELVHCVYSINSPSVFAADLIVPVPRIVHNEHFQRLHINIAESSPQPGGIVAALSTNRLQAARPR